MSGTGTPAPGGRQPGPGERPGPSTSREALSASREALRAWTRALERTAPIARHPHLTLPLVVEGVAERHGDAPALLGTAAQLSHSQLRDLASRHARWARGLGLGPGDTVALMMPNCPEYVAIWLGVVRTGAAVALINTHLAGDALAHSIAAVRPAHLIVDASLSEHVAQVAPRWVPRPAVWIHGPGNPCGASLPDAVSRYADAPLSAGECPLPLLGQTALYIYTSGTTGLPKAARVSHERVMHWSHWFAGLMDVRPEDRMYDCLPLYHSVGGVVAIGATLVGGGSVVIRPRFSAGDFWRDVREEGCTLFQYVGELCRYLLAATPSAAPIDHVLRLACGNGLRADVWEAFRDRFRIPHILEYYASTEGNFSLYNCEEEPGSIGRMPGFLAHRLPIALVRCDLQSGEPVRDESGRCQRCEPGEAGMAIGRIAQDATARPGRFEGYVDAQATERKILRNVFEDGDAWFHTGDLLRRDARGFHYFVDRLGDTYRWKGENVSTSEVQAAICHCPGIDDAVAYGVQVPGQDGRAGMAAVVAGPAFDVATFGADLSDRLPDYARPVFLRRVSMLDTTATHKPRKQRLIEEGFDTGVTTDPLWYFDRAAGTYVPLDASAMQAIAQGRLRL